LPLLKFLLQKSEEKEAKTKIETRLLQEKGRMYLQIQQVQTKERSKNCDCPELQKRPQIGGLGNENAVFQKRTHTTFVAPTAFCSS
jgi:hypothetical protein